jgi:hypothetical protein
VKYWVIYLENVLILDIDWLKVKNEVTDLYIVDILDKDCENMRKEENEV